MTEQATLRASLDALLAAHEGAELALVVRCRNGEQVVDLASGEEADSAVTMAAVVGLLQTFMDRGGDCGCLLCGMLRGFHGALAMAQRMLSASGGRVH